MAMDRANRRLFVTCHNEKMAVLDADSGKIIATPAIGKGTDFCAFDPDSKMAFSSNGVDGTLTVVEEESPDKFTVVANVKTETGARTMALDSKTHSIYLCTAKQKPAAPGAKPGRRAFKPHTFLVLVDAQ